MDRLARVVVRFPWLVLACWLIVLVVATAVTPSGAAMKTPSPHPTDAQRAYNLLDAAFPNSATSGNHPPTSVLELAPQRISTSDLRTLASWRPLLLRWTYGDMGWTPASTRMVSRVDGPLLSKDGRAALSTITYTFTDYCYSCNDYLRQALLSIRPHLQPGATLELTGQGLVYQAEDAAVASLTDSGLSPSLLACVALLLVILGAVFRAPLAVLMPLLAIGQAVYTSLHLVKTLTAHTSWVPYDNITNEFISVVLFGAGTNYCLFLLARYRESLRQGMAPREAIVHSLTRVGEAISSSAATVIAATAIMGLTLSPMLRAVGPSVAVSVAIMLLTGLTLVPALMCLCGRALLWPTRLSQHAARAQTRAAPRQGPWHWIGLSIASHPGLIAAACLLVLTPLAALASTLAPSYDDLRTLPTSDVAVRTAVAIQDHFGSTAEPAQLVIHDPRGGLDSASGARAITVLRTAAAAVPGVQLQPWPVHVAPGGQVAALGLVLDAETSSPAAHALVTRLQDALHAAIARIGRPGYEALLAADSAFTHDQRDQINGDFRFIVLWVSLIIFAILALLVRSLSAPFYLLLTVALSAGSSLGLTVLIFHDILGQQIYYTTPVFAFVFLVALGEDFNILLMARIREEVWRHGLRAGVARAVGATGGTLSSCGLIMAGTFGVFLSFSVTFLQQVGFAVAAGVLLDTFIIRPLLVPAIVCLLGRWNWLTVRGVAPLPQSSAGIGSPLRALRVATAEMSSPSTIEPG